MKIRRKLAKNCSIHGKNYEISGPYNFWTPVKSNIPDVWNWNCWTLFGSEIEVWDHGPLAPSPTLPSQWLRPCKFQLFWFSPTANCNRWVWSRPVKSCCATESLPVFIDFFKYPGLCRVFLPVFAAVSLESISDSKIIFSALQSVFFWRIRWLCSFTIHDPTIHDSCIN